MAFNETRIRAVWDKGKPVSGYDPYRWQKDECGAWMFKIRYGDGDSEWGWVIHQVDAGKGDELSNLMPLHSKNSVDTGDGPLQCPVKASGGRNIGV